MKGAHGNECIFGQQVQYYRRKADSNCYIEEAFINTPQVVKTCACTRADFECETGFIMSADGGKDRECVPLTGTSTASWDSCSSGTAAYRRVPRSKCVDGDVPPCLGGGVGGGHSAGAWFAMVFLPLALVGGIAGGLVYSPKHRAMAFAAWGKVRDRVRGVRYIRLTTDDADTLMDDYS